MQEQAATSPSSITGNFASLLAAFAAPAEKPEPGWNEDGLADDIATLSYEQALRTHARYRRTNDGELQREPDAADGPLQHKIVSSVSRPTAASPADPPAAQGAASTGASRAAVRRPGTLDENRKEASITIRLSKAECARLHERAAEAGLTVSAYLRSCTLEIEALRSQVKEALTQFRVAPSVEESKASQAGPGPSSSWRTRLFPRWSGGHRAAQA